MSKRSAIFSHPIWILRGESRAGALAPEFARIALTHADLGPYFAEANRRGYEVPVSVGQVADFKDPTRYMIYGWQAALAFRSGSISERRCAEPGLRAA